jgi:hypothetical protein
MAFTDAIISPSITSADIIQAVQDGLTAQGYTPTVANRIDAKISDVLTTAEAGTATAIWNHTQ